MNQSLKDIQVLRTVLGQLDAERPAAGKEQEGRTLYVERRDDFMKRLDLEIMSRKEKARILVTGQIGVGKSSEISHYYYKNRSENRPLWIHSDLEKEENPENCRATGVFLTIFRDLWSTIHYLYQNKKSKELIQIRDEILSRLIDWLKGEYIKDQEKVLFSFGGITYPVFLQEEGKDTGLSLILGKAAHHEAVSRPAQKIGSAPDSLINLLNKLLKWAADERKGHAPVIFIDHVDKIRSQEAAEDVLVKAIHHWNRLNASIIMTAPFENTIGELRHSVESNWGPPLMVYPVDFPEEESDPVDDIFRGIVKNAQLTRLIQEESLWLLSHYCGGILRMFVQFLIQASKEAHISGHDRIEAGDARFVVQMAKRAYYDYSPEAMRLLHTIVSEGTGLGKASELLRSPIGLIIKRPTDGKQNFRPHPLIDIILDNYRFEKRKG